jgi:predicted ATPase
MTKIRIKNFGPIKEGYLENDGWLDVKKVTVFIGNQGSGKSTVAKLISTFSWMEKALTRGDYKAKDFTDYNRFRKNYCAYHRLENYFFDLEGNDKAEIEYLGESYSFKYSNGGLTINAVSSESYLLPQVMYVPAERNFISYVKSPKALKLTSDSLVEFVTEFDNAKNEIKGAMQLPVNNVSIEYQNLNDVIYLKGEDYKIQLKEASSGYQSIVPLYLVSWYMAKSVKEQSDSSINMSSEEQERFRKGVEEIWKNETLSEDQRRIALSVLSKKFKKNAFINIVEEPEQNLFPSSQREILHSLLEFNNMNKGNKLIMTTHSPYLINYLTIAVEANKLTTKVNTNELKSKLNEIVPLNSTLYGTDLVVYQLDEKTGTIEKLKQYKGLPSDENYLNEGLAESNEEFSKLLDLEDLCQ